jgi:uncharacterized protein (TIGR03067 family)
MRTAALVLFGIAVGATPQAAGAPVPKHLMKEAEGEKAKLQGKWKVEAMRMGGKDIPGLGGQNFDMTIEFRGDKLTATANIGGTARKTDATLKHDATAGARRFTTVGTTTTPLDGKGAPKNEKDELFGYAFDGEKLLLGAAAGGSKEAPDPLKPGANDIVIVLARVK